MSESMRWLCAALCLSIAAAGCEKAVQNKPAGKPGGHLEISTAGGVKEPAEQPTAAGDEAADGQAAEQSPEMPPAPFNADAVVKPTEEELAQGWLSLFDGQSLFGWRHDGKADWRVENGAIVVESGEKGLLCTTSRFADYVFEAEFRCPKETNSGIFLRTPLAPTDPAKDCYELNIAAPEVSPFSTGAFVNRQKVEASFDTSEWRSFTVTAEGPKFTVQVDGKEVLAYDDPQPIPSGHIGLQLNSGRVEFRNLRIKPIGFTSIFNGQDLAGWKEYPEMASKFTVAADGSLNVLSGKGQLESEKQYGDFVLQLECQSHAKHLNSGVFFRCIPGEQMNGYECQIHNGFKNGDRTQPIDCGTGGIFRRQDARAVLADDLAWFSLTLIADGPHMAAWVNGVQVSDWIDERAENTNPRNGLRLAPGTLMLQGHDPTTNLSFRNLRIVELPD